MTCSTCGASVPPGRSRCATCGAPAGHLAATAPAAPGSRACPRCGWGGEGEGYFSRGANVAKLIGVTVLTSGVGAPIYFLLRYNHRICPRCGTSWGEHGRRSLGRVPAVRAPRDDPEFAVSRGRGLRRAPLVLYTMGALLAGVGVVEGEATQVAVGVGAGAGGWVVQRKEREARERRRQELLESLAPAVLKLAAQRGGVLTVSEVAASLGWTLPRATKVLQHMDDGMRVDSEVTDEGVIVYQFRELGHAPARLSP